MAAFLGKCERQTENEVMLQIYVRCLTLKPGQRQRKGSRQVQRGVARKS